MEIIKAGSLPSDVMYTTTCPNCKTQFRFQAVEAKTVYDQRDGNYLEITCPLQGCKHLVTCALPDIGDL